MVKELIAAGVTGDALIKEVMKFHGVGRVSAMEIIDIETGASEGDVETIVNGKDGNG